MFVMSLLSHVIGWKDSTTWLQIKASEPASTRTEKLISSAVYGKFSYWATSFRSYVPMSSSQTLLIVIIPVLVSTVKNEKLLISSPFACKTSHSMTGQVSQLFVMVSVYKYTPHSIVSWFPPTETVRRTASEL